MDVYLAGSMTGRKVREVLLERAEAKAILSSYGLTWYDPAGDEGLEKLNPESIISNAFDLDRMTYFVKKDLAAVAECRSVLNITGDMPSEGSTWEMAYAVFYRQIPVILVAPQRVQRAKMSFTNVLVDGLYNTLGEAVEVLSKKLKE